MSLEKEYSYHYIGPEQISNDDLRLRVHNYSFITKNNNEYIVQLDEYVHKVYCLKFYDKDDFDDKFKFKRQKGNLANGDFRDFRGIIATCMKICLDVYFKDTDSGHTPSFVFIGGNSIGEAPNNSKRFRIYKLIIANKVSKTNFSHHESESLSTYILLNVKLKTKPNEYNFVVNKLSEVGVDIDNLVLLDESNVLEEDKI